MSDLPRILVVDDEPLVAKSCVRILAGRGFDVVSTLSGEDGLNRAMSQPFDLVVTDLKMPDLDGMEIVRTLRRDRPDTQLVIMTGFGTTSTAVEAIKLGVIEYLEKPFTTEQFTDAVGKALAVAESKAPARARTEADAVREVLLAASSDGAFAARLLAEGSRVLAGRSLSAEAMAAIVSGDIAWIEKTYGPLSPGERAWLTRRLEAERW